MNKLFSEVTNTSFVPLTIYLPPPAHKETRVGTCHGPADNRRQ